MKKDRDLDQDTWRATYAKLRDAETRLTQLQQSNAESPTREKAPQSRGEVDTQRAEVDRLRREVDDLLVCYVKSARNERRATRTQARRAMALTRWKPT